MTALAAPPSRVLPRGVRTALQLAGAIALGLVLSLTALSVPRQTRLSFESRPDPALVNGVAVTRGANGERVAVLGAESEFRFRAGARALAVRLRAAASGPGPLRATVFVNRTPAFTVELTTEWRDVHVPATLALPYQPLRVALRETPTPGPANGSVLVSEVEATASVETATAPASRRLRLWLALLFSAVIAAAWQACGVGQRRFARSFGVRAFAVGAMSLGPWLAVALGPAGLTRMIPTAAAAAVALAVVIALALRHPAPEGQDEPDLAGPSRPLLAFAALATVILLAFLSDAIFTGRVLSQGDTLFRYYPWAAYQPATYAEPRNALLGDIPQIFYPWLREAKLAWQRGELPTWTPYMFAGHPFLGAVQTAVFSPFTAIGILAPLPGATVWIAFARLFVAGLGMFVFVRGLGCRWSAACFAGLAFLLNPFSVGWLEHPESAAMAWLPWLLWAGQRAAHGTTRDGLLLSVAVALEISAGHPETAFKLFLFSVSYAVWCAWTAENPRSIRGFGGRVGRLAWAHLLGLVTLSIQLVPFLEYLFDSRAYLTRQVTPLNPFTVPPMTAITALVPSFFGSTAARTFQFAFTGTNPCEMQAYPGLVTWFLAAVAVASSPRDARVRFFSFAIIPAALIMYGVPGVHQFVSMLPVFKVTVLGRFGLVVITSAVALAAIGLDRLLAPAWPTQTSSRTARIVIGLAMLVAMSVAISVACYWRSLAGLGIIQTTTAAVAGSLALVFAATALVVLRLTGRLAAVPAAAAALLLITIDLFATGYDFHPAIPPSEVFPAIPEITRLQQEPGVFRVSGWGDALAANAGQAYGLQDFRGYDGIWPNRYDVLLEEAFGAEQPYQKATDARAVRLLDLLNVRYIFASPSDVLPEGHFTRLDWGKAPLYRNEGALPRVFLVDHYVVARDTEALRLVKGPGLDLSTCVVLEADLPAEERPQAGSMETDSATISAYAHRRVIVDTLAQRRRVLVFSDRFAPGWKATLDGRPLAIRRADYAFRAVSIPAGRHRVEFIYDPLSIRLGAWMSVAGLAAMVALGVATRRSRSGE